MPVFQLDSSLVFPSVDYAEPGGLLAIGGDLGVQRLLLAYREGIFPWYNEGDPILWWSPDPRMVLYPEDVHISRSLRKRLLRRDFFLSVDTAFPEVLKACADTGTRDKEGTWLLSEMRRAYLRLHELGYAHSFEVWDKSRTRLCGGLYGVALGRVFFGESMFSLVSDASKIALVFLCRQLDLWDFDLIDCQVKTKHLASMGAVSIKRKHFIAVLKESLKHPLLKGPWSLDPSLLSDFT